MKVVDSVLHVEMGRKLISLLSKSNKEVELYEDLMMVCVIVQFVV